MLILRRDLILQYKFDEKMRYRDYEFGILGKPRTRRLRCYFKETQRAKAGFSSFEAFPTNSHKTKYFVSHARLSPKIFYSLVDLSQHQSTRSCQRRRLEKSPLGFPLIDFVKNTT